MAALLFSLFKDLAIELSCWALYFQYNSLLICLEKQQMMMAQYVGLCHPCMSPRVADSWLQSGPVSDEVVIWGVNQQMDYLCLYCTAFHNKQNPKQASKQKGFGDASHRGSKNVQRSTTGSRVQNFTLPPLAMSTLDKTDAGSELVSC